MIQIGLVPSNTLASLETDANGDFINIPEDQKVIPLIKNACPEPIDGILWEPIVEWFEDRVERNWKASELPPKTNEEIFKQKIQEGFQVNPEGFVLALGENDQAQFTKFLALLAEAKEMGMVNLDTPVSIKDRTGRSYEITYQRFRIIMVQYGFYYKSLWDQFS